MEHPKDPRIEIWNGIALIADDTHFTKWVKEHGSLITDPYHVAIAAKYIRKGDVVIDGGANIGTFTKAFADMVGENGTVFAYEPNGLAFDCLAYNAQSFVSFVTLSAYALGAKYGMCQIKDESQNHGMAYCIETKSNKADGLITSIDSESFYRLDFVKLDVEGWELATLQGAIETIKRFQPVFDIEINDATLARMGLSPNDIYQFMHDLGYTIAERIGEAPQVDVIFLPPNYQTRL